MGTHAITASVTDSGGLSGSDSVTGTVPADVVNIIKAIWKQEKQEIQVEATSSANSVAILTVEGFSQMQRKGNKYSFKQKPVAKPGTITVTSNQDQGGSDTATVLVD